MIDAHCHLEQEAYDKDLDKVIDLCKKEGLKAIITCCANPKDFDRSLEIVDKYKNYVFLCASIHPEYVKKFNDKQIDEYFERLKENRKKLVGIGETGLDYFWIKEPDWQENQKKLFIRHIELSKELKLPIVVHSRDACEDVLEILEQEDVKKVLLHMWGNKEHVKRIIKNNYFVSVGPIIARSKKHKKIVKDLPLANLMLETDSPWFGQNNERGLPTNVKIPCEKIAEIRGANVDYIENMIDNNSINFFILPIE